MAASDLLQKGRGGLAVNFINKLSMPCLSPILIYIRNLDESATKEAAERYGINLDNELKEHNLQFDKAERIINNNWYEVNQWIKAGKDISELVDNLASAYNQVTQPGDRDADRESREKDNRKNRNSTRDNAFLKAALMLLIKKL